MKKIIITLLIFIMSVILIADDWQVKEISNVWGESTGKAKLIYETDGKMGKYIDEMDTIAKFKLVYSPATGIDLLIRVYKYGKSEYVNDINPHNTDRRHLYVKIGDQEIQLRNALWFREDGFYVLEEAKEFILDKLQRNIDFGLCFYGFDKNYYVFQIDASGFIELESQVKPKLNN